MFGSESDSQGLIFGGGDRVGSECGGKLSFDDFVYFQLFYGLYFGFGVYNNYINYKIFCFFQILGQDFNLCYQYFVDNGSYYFWEQMLFCQMQFLFFLYQQYSDIYQQL